VEDLLAIKSSTVNRSGAMECSIIEGTIIGETAQAVLLKTKDKRKQWVPRSVIQDGDTIRNAYPVNAQ
jgi:RNase P/RNase MRP subunit p29